TTTPAAAAAPDDYRAEATIDESSAPSSLSGFEASVSHSSKLYLEAQPAEKLRLLLDILNKLSKTLELDNLLPKIVENLFALFKQADRCLIIMRRVVMQ